MLVNDGRPYDFCGATILRHTQDLDSSGGNMMELQSRLRDQVASLQQELEEERESGAWRESRIHDVRTCTGYTQRRA
jgi:hypothetical protein